MPDLDFDNKTKEELEAIAAEEQVQAEEAQAEADVAAAKAKKEAEEAAAAKDALDAAFAKKVAAEAGTPVGSSNKWAPDGWDAVWYETIAGKRALTDKAWADKIAGPRPGGWKGFV